jgi:hypothetical protein
MMNATARWATRVMSDINTAATSREAGSGFQHFRWLWLESRLETGTAAIGQCLGYESMDKCLTIYDGSNLLVHNQGRG